jgi:hypothetical protein
MSSSYASMARINRLTILFFIISLLMIASLVVRHFQAAGSLSERRSAPDADGQSLQRPQSAANANGQAITSFILSPATGVGGNGSTGTIRLRHPVPASGAVITLSNSDAAAATIPKSITIAPGQTSAHFSISTKKVKAYTSATVTASYDGVTETVSLILLPPEKSAWYVAPAGSPKGLGTQASPWDLATALASGPSGTEVKAGDTIWLRGGRYTGEFVSTLSGREGAPVIVRRHPGERAILDKANVSETKQPALKVKGSWVWFWGLEIMNSNPDRSRKSPYSGKDEPWRGSGADVYASNVKFINMIFHDNGHGIWDKQDMTEVHGSLFFYNGNNKREHALYVGNADGTKYITDNILFAQGGYGILAHSNSTSSSQKGLYLEGNVSFNNGHLTLDDQTTGNLQVGGTSGVPAERIVLKNNYIYNSPGSAKSKSNGIRLGYEDTGNSDVKLLDNYIVGKIPLRLWWWRSIELQGNTICCDDESFELKLPARVSPAAYLWDFNTYFCGKAARPNFIVDSSALEFSRWQQLTGLDKHSRLFAGIEARPSSTLTFIRPNKYEEGRAHIIIYNWSRSERVAVDVSSVLPVGANFEVRDVQNYFGEPLLRAVYKGEPLSLPVKLSQVAQPIGKVERVPTHTAPEFAVFVLQQTPRPTANHPKS